MEGVTIYPWQVEAVGGKPRAAMVLAVLWRGHRAILEARPIWGGAEEEARSPEQVYTLALLRSRTLGLLSTEGLLQGIQELERRKLIEVRQEGDRWYFRLCLPETLEGPSGEAWRPVPATESKRETREAPLRGASREVSSPELFRGEEASEAAMAGVTALMELWNRKVTACGGKFPKIKILSKGGKRYRNTQARLKEHPSLAFWEEVIDRILASPFCRGQNDRGWVADFDFLVRPDTAGKVLEGKYDADRWRGATPPPQPGLRGGEYLLPDGRIARQFMSGGRVFREIWSSDRKVRRVEVRTGQDPETWVSVIGPSRNVNFG